MSAQIQDILKLTSVSDNFSITSCLDFHMKDPQLGVDLFDIHGVGFRFSFVFLLKDTFEEIITR